jgi:hypothetical protein
MRSPIIKSFLLTAMFSSLAHSPLVAEPWSLVGCPPQGEARWRAFEHAVRTAQPGSTVYVPKPYPATPRQVIANYLYQYKSLQRDRRDPRSLPANEELVLAGIMNSTVTYEVLRVENWTTMRCGSEKRRDFYHLVRVFDAASGVELTRAVIDHSGLFFMLSNLRADQRAEPPARQRGRLPKPEEVMAALNARFDLHGESPQYVATFGSIDCDFASPCLAFRQDGRSFVLHHDEIFEIPANGKRLANGRDVGTPSTNAAVLAGLAPDERLVSLGGPVWTIAHKVAPSTLAHRG